jgi:hypothetical protein
LVGRYQCTGGIYRLYRQGGRKCRAEGERQNVTYTVAEEGRYRIAEKGRYRKRSGETNEQISRDTKVHTGIGERKIQTCRGKGERGYRVAEKRRYIEKRRNEGT